MDTQAHFRRSVLENEGIQLLSDIRRGIEKEGLRVNRDSGMLAQSPHPAALGSALTHGAITTDYSESLLEFITPVSNTIEANLDYLDQLHRFTAQNLDNELIWGASMPCIVAGEQGIPIASYGHSNVGTMKRVYRNGLGVRYGRMMQAIAGIHYNFSMPEAFWQQAHEAAGGSGSLTDFRTEGYLGLIRNFFSRVWLLIYLLGASPAVCASFLAGKKDHHLIPVGGQSNSFYLPQATALRMGGLGYNSDAQRGLQVCYNSLKTYISTLREAILTPHPAYEQYTTTAEGEQAQLNTALLQIENEFYSPIRPKRVTRSGEAPLVALQRDGIEYIEVRCVDINPFLPLGIDVETARIIDTFLVDCLISDSPPCDDSSRQRDAENLRRVVDNGRDTNQLLLTAEGEVTQRELATEALSRMKHAASLLDTAHGTTSYSQAMQQVQHLIEHPEETPSGRLLGEMQQGGTAFWQLALKYSKRWDKDFRERPLTPEQSHQFRAMAEASLAEQSAIEAADATRFDDFLAEFYQQYQEISS
ncbi:glutamate--cysteine ligase [Luminiphilus syltensis NOR5-1B]|uniref:Glutamate--cysteine ligase n=1 Tax=Luminiphilus syltensis NOR5-1B TaxID=565045 RepID=B8KST7_9GAMM|nr:glutamate--cysteine ligase [Luminiphilus syltensis]EED34983.1 glutamate--cysteine ligase [Luminiphilus syltensis NOR5-1B]